MGVRRTIITIVSIFLMVSCPYVGNMYKSLPLWVSKIRKIYNLNYTSIEVIE
jgi:hypothetical protein